jgi:hypothetical protein
MYFTSEYTSTSTQRTKHSIHAGGWVERGADYSLSLNFRMHPCIISIQYSNYISLPKIFLRGDVVMFSHYSSRSAHNNILFQNFTSLFSRSITMNCGCQSPSQINSWIDFQSMTPNNPLDLIDYAELRTVPGLFLNSNNFLIPGGATTPPVSPPLGPPPPAPPTPWVASPFAYNGLPVCNANGTDNIQMVSDATQWNFQHQTADTSAYAAIPIRKVIFLRGGTQWAMDIPLALGGANYANLQLGFRDNAATRGDFSGTYPVIDFSNVGVPFTGNVTLRVILKTMGHVSMVLRAIDNAGPANWSMFEMEWVIVP